MLEGGIIAERQALSDGRPGAFGGWKVGVIRLGCLEAHGGTTGCVPIPTDSIPSNNERRRDVRRSNNYSVTARGT